MSGCEPNYRRRGHVSNEHRSQETDHTTPKKKKKKPIIELIRTPTFAMPRKLKPSGDTLAPVPAPSPKLVRQLTSRKDHKTLGATSSAIALSISSAISDAGDASRNDDTVQGMNEIRKTAYAAVRIALEVAKEPSCLCPPLRAVVGATSALMKNYDVSVSCLRTRYLIR